MTSPFTSKSPLIIDLMPIHKGASAPTAQPAGVGLTFASTILQTGIVLDWSKLSGTFAFNVVFGYDASVTAGDQMVRLVDITNSSTILATASGNVNTDTSLFRTAIATTITFTKPAGVAKVGLVLDTVSSAGVGAVTFRIFAANILVT